MTQITQESNAVHALTTFDTDIVVDLGCCTYQRNVGGVEWVEDSIHTLIKRFKPQVLFGFDPHPGLPDAVGQVYGTTVITSRRAAWTYDGTSLLELQGNCTHVVDAFSDVDPYEAQVFDIANWVHALPDCSMVLKVDVEGAEYVLIPHLIEQGLMDRFSRLLIEWHKGPTANGYETDLSGILAGISCPIEEWQ